MWIIFDLDDTLIDTSGSITPGALKQAFIAMREAGFCPKNPEKAYRSLCAINAKSLSSRLALSSFGKRYSLPSTSIEIALEALNDPRHLGVVTPVRGAKELLVDLAKEHKLVLVTGGKRETQLKKMARAGIDQELFQDCYFCFGVGKKEIYQKIALKAAVSPDCIWVCGDRISLDLTPAKELGYHTVQLKWGRGLGKSGLKRDVDYTILQLEELKTVIKPALENVR